MGLVKGGNKSDVVKRIMIKLDVLFRSSMNRYDGEANRERALELLKVYFHTIDMLKASSAKGAANRGSRGHPEPSRGQLLGSGAPSNIPGGTSVPQNAQSPYNYDSERWANHRVGNPLSYDSSGGGSMGGGSMAGGSMAGGSISGSANSYTSATAASSSSSSSSGSGSSSVSGGGSSGGGGGVYCAPFMFRTSCYVARCNLVAPGGARSFPRIRECVTSAVSDDYQVARRLERWDPFHWPLGDGYRQRHLFVQFHTLQVQRGSYRITSEAGSRSGLAPQSMGRATFSFPRYGPDVALVLRSLPATAPTNAADSHVWPKGTSVYVNGKVCVNVRQRKQASHDPLIWTGPCAPLTIPASWLKPSNDLVVTSDDGGSFVMQLTPVRIRTAPEVVESMMRSGMKRNSIEKSEERAMKYGKSQCVTICDEEVDEEGDGAAAPPPPREKVTDSDSTTLTSSRSHTLNVSLIDGSSLSRISIPVTGSKCLHLQCFDLSCYVGVNSVCGGRRWRCPVCDKVTPCEELVIDELFVEFIEASRRGQQREQQRRVEGLSEEDVGGSARLRRREEGGDNVKFCYFTGSWSLSRDDEGCDDGGKGRADEVKGRGGGGFGGKEGGKRKERGWEQEGELGDDKEERRIENIIKSRGGGTDQITSDGRDFEVIEID